MATERNFGFDLFEERDETNEERNERIIKQLRMDRASDIADQINAARDLVKRQERKQQMKHTDKPVVIPRVVMKAIKEALNKLEVTNCAFKVILPNGEEHLHDPNDLLNPHKPIKRQRKDRPYGSLVSYYKPYVEDMKVGDVVEIPWGHFTAQELQSAVTAWCGQNWGNGTVTSSKNEDNQTVEILRLK